MSDIAVRGPRPWIPTKEAVKAHSAAGYPIEESSESWEVIVERHYPQPTAPRLTRSVKLARPTKVTVVKGKLAHAQLFHGTLSWQDLEEMAHKIKNKKVLYFYKCLWKREYRIKTNQDLEQLIDAGVLVKDWEVRIKFKLF